ncbi:Bck1p [Rhizophagus irregularis DAOM 197198w]|uniref:Bck1p n=1 Tax=Rhizophagus irregularis (strain DAOM 197198w) TaxID=1432141 RepID=A0A015K332_RHIIW|nr:Bck1p [Rhizophagus irregularis DAOM 197198w]
MEIFNFRDLTAGKKVIEENFANWTSGNETIDNFIQEKQLKYDGVEKKLDDGEAVFEWIPYNELIDIKEIGNNCLTTALWKEGPLFYSKHQHEWSKTSCEFVTLKFLYDLQNVTDEFMNKIDKIDKCYGISQNPVTKVYILVFNDKYFDEYCEKCGNEYYYRKCCKQCEINHLKNNFTNWTSGNEKIDNFIQKMQLKINSYEDKIFEWIPYNEIVIIKELENYTLAMWEKGPLYYNTDDEKLVRKSCKKVYLKYLYNSQEITDEFFNEVELYLENKVIFGISQNPDKEVYLLVFNDEYFDNYCEKCGNEYTSIYYKFCKQCEINHLKNNFTNWTSGNEKIDNLIQKMQLKINSYEDKIFEWIPYNEIVIIKELENYTLAMWEKGPLYYNTDDEKLVRKSCKKVYLKYLYNLQEITDEFLNEVESYLKNKEIFGISQNPDKEVYLLVFNNKYLDNYCEKCGNKYNGYYNEEYKWCKQCQINHLKNNFTNLTSGNEKIDNLIQKMQLKINSYDDKIFEWISYDEFIIIKELEYYTLAMWKKGPLYYNSDDKKLVRKSCENIYLKYLHNSQEITDEFLNEIESYLKNKVIFGISQNPDKEVYLLVFNDEYFDKYCEKCGNEYEDSYYKFCKQCEINHLKNNFTDWTSGNEKIDNFIQKMQLKINSYEDKIFEWISYNEFIIIKENYTLAIWEKGPLYCNKYDKKLSRESSKKVYLKYPYNSQEITDEFFNKVESYLKNKVIFGISQNPDTEVYLLVFNDEYFDKYCEKCDWTSGNDKVDNSIQKLQLKINSCRSGIFEWISYNKFIEIKEIGNDVFAKAIWKDGPLYYSIFEKIYKRELNKKVILKYLCNPQNVNHLFLNEVIYSVEENHGVTQNPNTKDYMLVCKIEYYCENCGKKYNNQFERKNKSCISCQTNPDFKKINDLIQEIKLNIDHNSCISDIMFNWIPYDQFNNIREIGKGGFSTVYSAIWKDALISYESKTWERKLDTRVALKCLSNSQDNLDEFINEVKAYTNQKIDNILKIYGISQNPNTKEYIMVLEYAEGGNFNSYLKLYCKDFNWSNRLEILTNIIEGLNKIHQKQMVHRDFHTGNILFTKLKKYGDYMACISDMGLCKKVNDINETNIYGVMPYVAPEVLKGNPYTPAADIYSFGMIMYVIATGKQPFSNCAHDEVLALNICNGIRPEINDQIAPKCYTNLMKKCWDSNPDNRPNSVEIKKLIRSFRSSQFDETREYRNEMFELIKNNQLTTHAQAIYTSRLLNPFTKNLPKYNDNINNNTVEITDFTK